MMVVIDPGWATRIVDAGRRETRSLGVPIGGAADRASWMLGNALVGNPPDAPALEIALKGPILRAEAEIGCVVFGAPFVLGSARQTLRPSCTFTLSPGEELHIGGTPLGVRAYLCVPGSFHGPEVLGSRSGLTTIQPGDSIPCSSTHLRRRFLLPACPLLDWTDLKHASAWVGGYRDVCLRVLTGLQASWFSEHEFYKQGYSVSPASDRMGVRLTSESLTMPKRELLSEPVCPGTVQVTRDGQCIILGVDGQTIGGYPKIAQVIHADLDLLGQLRPGDTVRFHKIDLAAAEAAGRGRDALLHEWITRARVSLAG